MFVSIKKSIIIVLILSLIPAASVFARGEKDSAAEISGSIELVDHFGRRIVLEGPAESVVSLAPGITETVFALGYGDRLAGRTSWCDFPPEAASVSDIGSLMEPDLETIVALDPDLVIGSTHFTEESLAMLENAGLNVAVLMGPDSFEGIYEGVIRPVAAVFGDEEAGESLIAGMKSVAETAEKQAATIVSPPSVYYVVGFGEGGDWTAGGDTFIGQMMEKAGARSIAADTRGWAFSAEAIVDRDPDIILIPAWASGMFEVTEPYSGLRAVREGRVFIIDENAIVRQGPRVADGFASLVGIFAGADGIAD